MILVRVLVAKTMKGNDARMTSEKLHPFEKAKVMPDIVIENAMIIVPVFSPRAFAIA